MPASRIFGLTAGDSIDREPRLKEVVMGLHWDPPVDARPDRPADLDALCLLLDCDGQALEIIHPGHTRSLDGSVIHTGDSRTGASHWDDERIFVFLEALPGGVSKVSFLVSSAAGVSFDAIPGASCHVSDPVSDMPWIRVDLTTLCGQTVHTVAVLCRDAAGWRFSTEPLTDDGLRYADLAMRARSAK
jgi:stress response protein SCP2